MELFQHIEKSGKSLEHPELTKKRISDKHLGNLKSRVGLKQDEISLSADIAIKISERQREVGIEPNILNINPKLFSYTFTFMHIWHQKFASNRDAKIEANDLYDMQIAATSSLCAAYFGERSYVRILHQIKSSKVKSQYKVARRVKKMNPKFDMLAFENIKPELDLEHPLLQNTLLFSYSELCKMLEKP